MIHIFYMHFDTSVSDRQKDLYMQFLSDTRKRRVQHKRSSEAAMKCMQTGLFLRYGLEQTGYGKEYANIICREDGKPVIPNHPVHFNLSHSGDYVVLMIADSQCGIDIQNPVQAKDSLAKHVLHEQELRIYRACDGKAPYAGSGVLTQFWCLKEAYLKYTGAGIRFAMSKLNLADAYVPELPSMLSSEAPADYTCVQPEVDAKTVYFASFALADSVVSICVDSPERMVCVTGVTPGELFSHFIHK